MTHVKNERRTAGQPSTPNTFCPLFVSSFRRIEIMGDDIGREVAYAEEVEDFFEEEDFEEEVDDIEEVDDDDGMDGDLVDGGTWLSDVSRGRQVGSAGGGGILRPCVPMRVSLRPCFSLTGYASELNS